METPDTGNRPGRVAELIYAFGQYVLSYPEYSLEIRAKFPEWAFMAAAEILGEVTKVRDQNDLDTLVFTADDAEDQIDNEIGQELVRYRIENRYETAPQCGVTYDGEDYKWVVGWARAVEQAPFLERLYTPTMRAAAGKARVVAPDVDNLPDLPISEEESPKRRTKG